MTEEHDGATGCQKNNGDSTLPDDVAKRAEQLTRRAREAVDENEAAAYREAREELLDEHDYRARIREEEDDVLVMYPDEWLENGVAQLDAIEDLDRGVERPLEGAGDADHWQAVEDHNRNLATQVESEYGEVHGANAHALADFMSNHYAKHIERATGEELTEFLEEYFPRNAWPSDEQQAVVETTLQYVFEYTDTEPPKWQK